MTNQYIVAFCGLPSSGKSTLINSLIGERILQTGVSRTTTEHKILPEITDDDNNKFTAIDLPGICDSEEKDTKFDELTEDNIKKANLICFVSDVNKAFITTHEMNEFIKLKNIVKKIQEEEGKIYDVVVILTKCDYEENMNNKNIKTKIVLSNFITHYKYGKEISDSDEDTDLGDLIKTVKEKLPNQEIMLFNAFGRINYFDDFSDQLKKIVKKSKVVPSNNNIKFSISKFCKNIKSRQEESYADKFCEKIDMFLEDKIQINKVIESFYNMNNDNQYYMIKKYSEHDEKTKINFKIYVFIETILEKTNFYNRDKSHFAAFRFNYTTEILNDSLLLKMQNLKCDFTNETIWEAIVDSFNCLDWKLKYAIINKVIFESCIFKKHQDATIFLKKCFMQSGGYEKYNFKNKFNDFILSCEKSDFEKFYNIMMPFCVPTTIQKPQITQTINVEKFYKSFSFDNNIQNLIHGYLGKLERQINDQNYILYNKIQILYNLFMNPATFYNSTNIEYHYKNNKLKGNTIIESKILNSNEFLNIEEKFYENMIGFPIISHKKINDIVFLSPQELMYKE